jgi:septal ring factor EnvC (AmiA/AmiB activator)
VHNVLLKSNKPVKPNQDLFNMFGGFQGFVNFTSEQARTKGQIDAYQDRIDELKEQKAQLLAKVGNYEAENKKLERDIRQKEDQNRELKWQYEDKIRDLNNENDKELRKYNYKRWCTRFRRFSDEKIKCFGCRFGRVPGT